MSHIANDRSVKLCIQSMNVGASLLVKRISFLGSPRLKGGSNFKKWNLLSLLF